MIDHLFTIEGLGGTGKTYQITKLCHENSKAGRQVVYLTYNKKIADSQQAKIILENVSISTIHSLIYQELKEVSQLPDNFEVSPSGLLEKDASDEDFAKLVNTFLKYFADDNEFTFIGDDCVLIVDEYQNVDSNLIKVLKLICSKQKTTLYLVGDRYQAIYSYREENKGNNFDTIEATFGHAIDATNISNLNHRSNSSVLGLINGFLLKNISVDSRFLYKMNGNQTSEKQKLVFLNNRKDEFDYVKQEAIRFHRQTGKRVVILSRAKRGLVYFQDWQEKVPMDWLTISTIHKFIGGADDYAFIVGFEPPNSVEEAKVTYTGLIRGREKVTITTSLPAFDSSLIISGDSVEVINKQKKLSKPFKALKLIKANKNLTRGKFKDCMIDSITLAVREADLPFIRFIKRQGGLDTNSYETSYITSGIVPIKVTYHHGAKMYKFEMKDVNLLRSNRYTDGQVVKYLTNFILEYFGYQICCNQIHVQSIDLCKIVESDDGLISLLKEDKIRCTNRMNDKKELIGMFSTDLIQERTVYYNFTSIRSKSLIMAIYRPIDKKNKNRYFDPKAIKVELRLGREAIQAKYAFGEDINVEELLSKLKVSDEYLLAVFGSVIRYRTKKSEGVLKENRGVDGKGKVEVKRSVGSKRNKKMVKVPINGAIYLGNGCFSGKNAGKRSVSGIDVG